MVSNMNYEDKLNDEGGNLQLESEFNEVYPWRRYFARMIDLSCLGIATTLFFLPYIPIPLVKMLIDLLYG